MAESQHISQTLTDFKDELKQKIAELFALHSMINHLEDRLGIERSDLGDFLENAPVTHATPQISSQSGGASAGRRQGGGVIRPDHFLGVAPLDAAKQYIAMVGHAVHFDEIADAIQKGGAAVNGSDWRDKLEVSLVRSVYEVVKVQEKTFGLTTFYSEEQIRRLRKTRARPEPKKKKRASKKAKAPQPKDEAAS